MPQIIQETSTTAIDCPFKQISVGAEHSLILRDDGQLFCVGSNAYGQLGLPEEVREATEMILNKEISDLDVDFVECGHFHSLVSAKGGKVVYSFGYGRSGQRGDDAFTRISFSIKEVFLDGFMILGNFLF